MQSNRMIWLSLLLLFLAKILLSYCYGLTAHEAYWTVASDNLRPYFPLGGVVPAFIVKVGTFIFGDSEFGVRFFGIVISTLSIWCFYLLIRSTIDAGTAAWVILIVITCPIIHLGSVLFTSVGLGVQFGLIGLYFLWNSLLKSKVSSVQLMSCSAIFYMLAVNSHPIGYLLVLPSLVALIVIKRWRARWKNFGLWVWGLIIIIGSLPIILWLGFSDIGKSVSLYWMAEFQYLKHMNPSIYINKLIQALLGYNPLLLIGVSFAVINSIKKYKNSRDYGLIFLAFHALPPLLIGFALSIESRSGILWLVPGMIIGIAILAEQWGDFLKNPNQRILIRTFTIIVSIILSVAISSLDIVRITNLPLNKQNHQSVFGTNNEKQTIPDPSMRLQGWDSFAEHLGKVIEGLNDKPFLIGNSWQTSSLLSFYLKHNFDNISESLINEDVIVQPVADLTEPDTFIAWSKYATLLTKNNSPSQYSRKNALYISNTNETNEENEIDSRISNSFQEVKKISEVVLHRGKTSLRKIQIYLCIDYQGERL